LAHFALGRTGGNSSPVAFEKVFELSCIIGRTAGEYSVDVEVMRN